MQNYSDRSFTQLQRGLTGDRSLIGEPYMENEPMLSAYMAFYWPVSHAQATHALSLAFNRHSPPKVIIDAGSGPAPVAAAFVDAGAEAVVLLDRSRQALDLALREIPVRCGKKAGIQTLVCDIGSPDPERIPMWGQADCISFGHSLNELWAGDPGRTEKRTALLEKYAVALSPGGKILVIEPALLSTSRDLLAVRNRLVAHGWRVIAACPGREQLPCPALSAGENQTCHDEIRWTMPDAVAKMAATLKLDKESLKMTWFVFEPPKTPLSGGQGGQSKHGGAPKPAQGTEHETLNPGNTNLCDSTAKPDDTAPLYRVVSDPLLNKAGRTRYLICGRNGRFPLSAARNSQDGLCSVFFALRRGDRIQVQHPEIRENGWGVSFQTVILKKEW